MSQIKGLQMFQSELPSDQADDSESNPNSDRKVPFQIDNQEYDENSAIIRIMKKILPSNKVGKIESLSNDDGSVQMNSSAKKPENLWNQIIRESKAVGFNFPSKEDDEDFNEPLERIRSDKDQNGPVDALKKNLDRGMFVFRFNDADKTKVFQVFIQKI